MLFAKKIHMGRAEYENNGYSRPSDSILASVPKNIVNDDHSHQWLKNSPCGSKNRWLIAHEKIAIRPQLPEIDFEAAFTRLYS